jgi:hypothetical protein
MDLNIDYALQLRMLPSNTPIYGPDGLTTVGAILPPGVPRVNPEQPALQPAPTTKVVIPWMWIIGASVLAYFLLNRKKES